MKLSFPLKVALISFLIAGAGVTSVALLTFGYASGLLLDQSLENIARDLERESTYFAGEVVGMVDDGRFFARSDGVRGLIRAAAEGAGVAPWRVRLERQFMTVMHDRDAYVSMRVIGLADDGLELVRVERLGESLVAVPPGAYQHKGGRPYFQRSVALPAGSHYISPANLNREWGRIVEPRQPTIRVGVPLFDEAGEPFGALVINADFDRLTSVLHSDHPDLHYLMTNEHGDYLFHPDPTLRFRFEQGGGARLWEDFPELDPRDVAPLEADVGYRRGYAIGPVTTALTGDGERAVVIRELLFPFHDGTRRFLLGAVVSHQVLNRQVEAFQRVQLWVILATSLLLAVMIALAARYLTRPILQLTAVADRIAAGDEKVEVPEVGGDEVGRLAASVRAMLAELRRSHRELRRSADSLELEVVARTRDLDQALRRVEASAAAKSEFLANMSHELRTPMHAILSFAAMARDKLDSAPREKFDHYLRRIDESGGRLLYLLNDLLDLSKLEAGMMEFTIEEHDLPSVARAAAEEFDELLRRKELDLEIHESEGAVTARFDRQRILQVVHNLISNAVKFSPNQGLITIACRADTLPSGEPAVALTVTDFGVGIPEQELDAVFDKFVQSSKTKNGAGGTGLGLAICKEIIDGHGGRIWVEPNPVGGARFTFMIPTAGPAAEDKAMNTP